MIVGCAGAGKTTLLRRLQKQGLEELKQVESTVGLEVHENMFEITPNGCLKGKSFITPTFNGKKTNEAQVSFSDHLSVFPSGVCPPVCL
jgi:GTPase SAR1 family protein